MATTGRGIPLHVTLPTSTNGTDSRPFGVPEGSKVMTISVPALVGAAATLKLQSLTPEIGDGVTEVWVDVSVFNLTDGSFVVLDGLVESTTVTIPVSATGAGPLRFVASEAQTGVADAITVKIMYGRDG